MILEGANHAKPLYYIHDALPVFIADTKRLSNTIQCRSVLDQDQAQAQLESVIELVVLWFVVTLCLLLACGGV